MFKGVEHKFSGVNVKFIGVSAYFGSLVNICVYLLIEIKKNTGFCR